MKDENNYNLLAQSLVDDLEDIAKQAVENEIQEYVLETLRSAINDRVYSIPQGNSYDRTYDLLRAATIDIIQEEDRIRVIGYIEPSKLSFSPYIAHSSWVDGSDQRENIAMWLEYGNNLNGGNPIVEYKGRYYFQYAFERIDRGIMSAVRVAFRNLGCTVK